MSRFPDLSALGPKGVKLFKRRAAQTAEQPEDLRALAKRAGGKLAAQRGHLGSLRDDIPVLIRFVRAYAYGRYRQVPWRSLVLIVAGLLYFVSPIDLIPDWIVGIGLLDDAAVVAFVLRAVHEDLMAFTAWEDEDAAQDELA